MEVKNQQSDDGAGSVVDRPYAAGWYFRDPRRHSEDAKFKADSFLRLFLKVAHPADTRVHSYVDVGCGSGDVIKMVASGLRNAGFELARVKGYDVSPHAGNISNDEFEFISGDFCQSNERADLVTLFDVFEHVPDPVSFIRQVAQRCSIIGFHIPLDNSLNVAMRDVFRAKLKDPGHLVFMDTVSALNILAFSGLRVVAYDYTFGFLSPSGQKSIMAKLVLPIRALLSKFNPWLLSKTIGGASLVVIALTPTKPKNSQD
jgi:SAM-dependent methyltransferase